MLARVCYCVKWYPGVPAGYWPCTVWNTASCKETPVCTGKSCCLVPTGTRGLIHAHCQAMRCFSVFVLRQCQTEWAHCTARVGVGLVCARKWCDAIWY